MQKHSLFKAFSNLIYPPICQHCERPVVDDQHLFCFDCLILLEMIDISERCPYCFSSDYHPKKQVCSHCSKQHPVFHRLAAVFEYIGPASTLVKKLKYGNMPRLSQGAGAYLAAQFLQLEWPLPDVIIPVPISFTRWIERGYNQSYLLAAAVSEVINRPVKEALQRKCGDFSQAGLDQKQRISLTGSTICIKKNQQIQDKTLLLIDDVMTTGTTMRKCAEALLEECPSHIYGLTLCHAIK